MKIDVLDKGYVRLVDSMGNDLSVVNAARVSYDKESQEFEDRDDRLLNFLVREKHTAPFRHAIVSYEVYAPLMVKNQWFKHLIGGIYHDDAEFPGLDPYFAWNESSRRYVTENEEFYIPSMDAWRKKPANSKQGSDGFIPSGINTIRATHTYEYGADISADLRMMIHSGVAKYRLAMESEVAPEQARLFLPAYAMYVRWRWTTSLQGAMHFIQLRDESHAQAEIQEYARAIREVTRPAFPVSMGATDVE